LYFLFFESFAALVTIKREAVILSVLVVAEAIMFVIIRAATMRAGYLGAGVHGIS
jgi:hypothetical protein